MHAALLSPGGSDSDLRMKFGSEHSLSHPCPALVVAGGCFVSHRAAWLGVAPIGSLSHL